MFLPQKVMIPQNELRTGNWVLNNSGTYCKIISGTDIDKYEGYSPTTITDGILKRCGFTFNQYFKLWQLKRKLPKAGSEMEMNKDYNVRAFGHRYINGEISTLPQLKNCFSN